jgi:hypothetical protein
MAENVQGAGNKSGSAAVTVNANEIRYTDSFPALFASLIAYFLLKPEDKVAKKLKNSTDTHRRTGDDLMSFVEPELKTSPYIYNKNQAITDTNAVVDNIFERFKIDKLPQIYQVQNVVNCYNNTTAQLMANDAYARTVSESAEVQFQAILKYAQVRASDVQAAAAAIHTGDRTYENIGVGSDVVPFLQGAMRAIQDSVVAGLQMYDNKQDNERIDKAQKVANQNTANTFDAMSLNFKLNNKNASPG